MENNIIKIRSSVRSNLFRRLGEIAVSTYYEKYHFYKFFEMVTAEKVNKYRQYKNLSYYEASWEYWLYIMFGWTEYDEEKYAELLEMPLMNLYDKLSLVYKKYLVKEKFESIEKDFE